VCRIVRADERGHVRLVRDLAAALPEALAGFCSSKLSPPEFRPKNQHATNPPQRVADIQVLHSAG
jgi:hypothetical protein